MSGIAGIFNRDGRHVSPEILQRMTMAARHRGPDAINSWIEQPVAFSQLLMATTPEARHETRPFHDPASGTCIVFDGRIDNRAELIGGLTGHGAARQGDTDMELVLRAYLLWGTDCIARILGDFAFALWDSRRRQLFCGRDIAAIKPFFYAACGNAFAFGSEIGQVLQHPAVSDAVNEGMVGEILVMAFTNREETLYRDILRLPAAHFLLADEGSVTIRRYWEVDPQRRLRYRNDDEYVEHFQDLLRDAVHCRLRCDGKVGATLSGGLDSPSIAGMAQTILNAGGDGKALETFSLVYPGRDCDESAWIDESVARWGFSAHRHAFSGFERAPAWAEQVRESRCLPETPTQSALALLYRIARASDVRVLLSGVGAATWLGGTDYPYLRLLEHRRIGELVGELRFQAATRGWKHAGSRLGRSLLWPVVPKRLGRYLEASRRRSLRGDFLQDDFARAIDLEQRVRRYDSSERYSDLAQWESCHYGSSGSATHHLESEDVAAARSGIEERHPFWDRRLIEFAVAIPDYCHHHEDRRKLLLRRSGEQLLPRRVRDNPAQAEFGSVFVEALRHEEVRRAFESMIVANRGWVSAARVNVVYKSVAGISAQGRSIPDEDYRLLWPLWMVFATECWQRNSKGGVA